MQWPSVNYKRFASLALVLSVSTPLEALDDDKLWLPTKHAKRFLDLRKAALEAEKLDRCVKVLRGTMDLDQSSAEHPIYRILCRQPNGRTYNEMVDGVTFETLTTKIEVYEPTEEEIEAKRQARITALWSICENELKNQIRLMKDVHWLTDFPPEPSKLDEMGANFEVSFNANDVQGAPLKYQAICTVVEEGKPKIRIKGRK